MAAAALGRRSPAGRGCACLPRCSAGRSLGWSAWGSWAAEPPSKPPLCRRHRASHCSDRTNAGLERPRLRPRLAGHLARDPFSVCLAPPPGRVSLGSGISPFPLPPLPTPIKAPGHLPLHRRTRTVLVRVYYMRLSLLEQCLVCTGLCVVGVPIVVVLPSERTRSLPKAIAGKTRARV